MWEQAKKPNLNVKTSLGMCLKYVQDAYGSGWAGSYALQGWNDLVKFKHRDRNIPSGVYVPIWFEGYWNGVNYGHVAIYKDGIVYSSPYTNKTTHDQLGNIATVERIYGMKYIGWSEDIGGTRVIKERKNDVIDDSYKYIMRGINSEVRGWDESKVHTDKQDKLELNIWRGKNIKDFYIKAWNESKGFRDAKKKWKAAFDKLPTVEKNLTAKTKELDTVKKELATVKAERDKLKAENKSLGTSATEAEKKYSDVLKKQQETNDEAESFITAVINKLRNLFK